jgi:oxalate decarboxylase/phosphoglucose isomerase-like protein (cupin superfamily)
MLEMEILDSVGLIALPKISDPRGNLTFIQFPQQVPFEIKRVFWTYNVPSGELRGGHSYKSQQEVIVALSGSFDVVVKSANGDIQRISLNRGDKGIYLPQMTWRHLENFSTNAVSLHLSSSFYDEDEYLRNFELLER